MPNLRLVSYHLCPYVQRAAIALAEKGAPFERVQIDLADKPDWFRAISPLGKVPLLLVGDEVLFESSVICEFIEETAPGARLHPEDPLERARHRSWMEFGSSVLNEIAGFYSAPDEAAFEKKRQAIRDRLTRVEDGFGAGPWFGGETFSLVDAAFGPVFRYFDAFEAAGIGGFMDGLPKLAAWRGRLAARPSVRDAVAPDYPARLRAFLAARPSHLGTLVA